VGVHGIGNRRRSTTPGEAAVAYYSHHLAKDTAQGAGDPEHLARSGDRALAPRTLRLIVAASPRPSARFG
jgi:hypothetical protein